jgi:hypothetical protein
MRIQLTNNHFALIDEQDFETINQRRWYAVKLRNSLYAVSSNHPSNKVFTKMHRMILGVTDPMVFVDHINHNGLDNRRSNLRICTAQQNNMNAKKRKGLWKYKGVAFDSRSNYWYARIRHNNKLIHIGTFQTIEDAAYAYNQKAVQLFGQFACLNDIDA